MSNTNNNPAKVIIVDDHPIVREGIRSLLQAETDLTICGQAESAAEALSMIEKEKPDVALVDIGLKGTDGLELTKSVRAFDETMPILIMSMHDESLYAERALRAGANGYIMKEQVAERIVEGIRSVLKGQIFVSEAIRQKILYGVRGRKKPGNESPVESLSDRELEVFQRIGQGQSTRQIAEALNLSIKTIETYRAHIKEKLNLESAPELVRYAVHWLDQSDA